MATEKFSTINPVSRTENCKLLDLIDFGDFSDTQKYFITNTNQTTYNGGQARNNNNNNNFTMFNNGKKVFFCRYVVLCWMLLDIAVVVTMTKAQRDKS